MAQPGLMTRSLHHRGFCARAKSLPELLDSKGCRILGYLGKHKRKPKRLKIKTSLIGRLPHLLTFIEYESFGMQLVIEKSSTPKRSFHNLFTWLLRLHIIFKIRKFITPIKRRITFYEIGLMWWFINIL